LDQTKLGRSKIEGRIGKAYRYGADLKYAPYHLIALSLNRRNLYIRYLSNWNRGGTIPIALLGEILGRMDEDGV